MEIPVIRIGKSKGIRLAKAIFERYQITDRIELVFEEGYLILKPAHRQRIGWEAAFKKMHESGEDEPLMDDGFEDELIEEGVRSPGNTRWS